LVFRRGSGLSGGQIINWQGKVGQKRKPNVIEGKLYSPQVNWGKKNKIPLSLAHSPSLPYMTRPLTCFGWGSPNPVAIRPSPAPALLCLASAPHRLVLVPLVDSGPRRGGGFTRARHGVTKLRPDGSGRRGAAAHVPMSPVVLRPRPTRVGGAPAGSMAPSGGPSRWCLTPPTGYQVSGRPSFGAAPFWEPSRPPLTMEEFRMQQPNASEVLIKTKGPVSATPLPSQLTTSATGYFNQMSFSSPNFFLKGLKLVLVVGSILDCPSQIT
jgi:hypothetical protein